MTPQLCHHIALFLVRIPRIFSKFDTCFIFGCVRKAIIFRCFAYVEYQIVSGLFSFLPYRFDQRVDAETIMLSLCTRFSYGLRKIASIMVYASESLFSSNGIYPCRRILIQPRVRNESVILGSCDILPLSCKITSL